jgi:hypothetical protein
VVVVADADVIAGLAVVVEDDAAVSAPRAVLARFDRFVGLSLTEFVD